MLLHLTERLQVQALMNLEPKVAPATLATKRAREVPALALALKEAVAHSRDWRVNLLAVFLDTISQELLLLEED